MLEKQNGKDGLPHMAEATGAAAAPAPAASLLVIEDDENISAALVEYFSRAGYTVTTAADGVAGVDAAIKVRPDVVVLDLMLPKMDGLAVCKELRQKIAQMPIIMLTAKDDVVDRVLGLEMGADDYITKPFSPKEVVARVKAVLRRFDQPLKKEIVRAGDLVIDTAAMRLTVRNESAVTTATEFRLIEFLASHPGRVFTRKSLLDAVWHDTAFVTPRIVDVYIRRLREKIERDPEKPRHIHTVRGAGYMFEVRK